VKPGAPPVVATLARRGLLRPGPPRRVAAQLAALRRWGFGIAGELGSAAARDPDRVALVDDPGGALTYGELLHRASALARTFRTAYGVGPGERIGVLCRNSSGLVVAHAAGALLGADTVLVNTGLSAPQVADVAAGHALRLLVHDTELADRAAEVPPRVTRIAEAELPALVAAAPPGVLSAPPRQGHTIVLTSGTTGTPKGARRRNPGGFGPLVSILDRIPLSAGARVLIAAPVFHTWGYAALQLTFALRGTAVLQRRFVPASTVDALRAHGCTTMFAVPVMLQRLLDAGAVAPPRLDVVAVSGSALPGDLATRFMDAYGDVLYNLYGSTEVSWASIATPADLRRAPGTAGRPPRGTRVAIVDGRIFVGNDMLFEGYTGGAGREAYDGMLATGDLGHLDPSGLLFVDGREDDLVVSGGENVFPSEVEDLVARLPAVREVAVVGVPDAEFGQRLAAYVALRPGAALDAEAVREHVRRHRARHAVPRDVVFVEALPRNATGKVVPRDLPPPTS
jgi:acyl-CoA synthetase (AMP-forming)/AMP-acid ligase II